jgi:uncharacterized protein YuzB (UPF0349 family)
MNKNKIWIACSVLIAVFFCGVVLKSNKLSTEGNDDVIAVIERDDRISVLEDLTEPKDLSEKTPLSESKFNSEVDNIFDKYKELALQSVSKENYDKLSALIIDKEVLAKSLINASKEIASKVDIDRAKTIVTDIYNVGETIACQYVKDNNPDILEHDCDNFNNLDNDSKKQNTKTSTGTGIRI